MCVTLVVLFWFLQRFNMLYRKYRTWFDKHFEINQTVHSELGKGRKLFNWPVELGSGLKGAVENYKLRTLTSSSRRAKKMPPTMYVVTSATVLHFSLIITVLAALYQ